MIANAIRPKVDDRVDSACWVEGASPSRTPDQAVAKIRDATPTKI